MNEVLRNSINLFIENVVEYLQLEYSSIYATKLVNDHDRYFDFIGSYYMGGANVPDTARYFVEHILNNNRDQ